MVYELALMLAIIMTSHVAGREHLSIFLVSNGTWIGWPKFPSFMRDCLYSKYLQLEVVLVI